MSFFDKVFGREEAAKVPKKLTNSAEALSLFRNGEPWPRKEPEVDQTAFWPEARRLMAPYHKHLADECAQVYLGYVANTGNTSCPMETVAFKMREILWEAWRRAGITNNKKFKDLNCLPDLRPYFVAVVQRINMNESIENMVAYICVKNIESKDIYWYIAPTIRGRQNPRLASSSKERIIETLY